MTEDKTLTRVSKKILPISMVLAGSVLLAACSSKPSPWSETESPWDNRAEEGAESIEPMATDGTVEPMGMEAMEGDVLPIGANEDTVIEQPMEMIEEPIQMVEEEPPMEATVSVGGGLAGQPAGYYAVQVVASSTMDQLTSFARQHQIDDQLVAETNVHGKVWYVLMLGIYPSKGEAEQALLSVQDLETQPWIRTVGSLQSAMN